MNFQFEEFKKKQNENNNNNVSEEVDETRLKYNSKQNLLGLESLDSLGVFMRQNGMANSAKYPFYNNYDASNIAQYQGFVYQSILNGNKYNNTNIGINPPSRTEAFEDYLDRQMKVISKTNSKIKGPPNSLQILGSSLQRDSNGMAILDDYFDQGDKEVQLQGQLNENQEVDDDIQNERDFLSDIIEPFKEEDFELARINNKFFDNVGNYSQPLRPRPVTDPVLFQQTRTYFEEKHQNKRGNKYYFVYYIHSDDSIRSRDIEVNTRKKKVQQEKNIEFCSKGNTMYKIDLERKLYRSDRVELNGLEKFSQIQIKGTQELFLCGGKSNGIAQKECLIIDFTLNKFLLKNGLEQPRYDHLVLQLEEYVYIIGGKGLNGETLLSCEKFNVKTQNIKKIAPLQLTLNSLCGAVSELNKCLYVAGVPLIIENQVQLQKFEPHTNFWELIKVDVSFLFLKQPRLVKLALHDESIYKSQLYFFCHQLKQHDSFTLSLQDITAHKNTNQLTGLAILSSQSQPTLHTLKKMQLNNSQSQLMRQTQSSLQSQQNLNIPQHLLEDPKRDPLFFVSEFNEQCKINYSSKKRFEETLNQKRQLLNTLETIANRSHMIEQSVIPGTTIKVRPVIKEVLAPTLKTGQNFNVLSQYDNIPKISQSARIEIEKSEFEELNILISHDFEVFTMNLKNPVELERFDFLNWTKKIFCLQFFPNL